MHYVFRIEEDISFMKPTFISMDKNSAKFSIEFSAEEFESAIVDVYKATKGRYAIDGFRKGKAPRRLIETHYGEDIFFEDAINNLFSNHYPSALDELKLNVIDRPNAEFSDIEKGKAFTITITVDVYPKFEVKEYKGVEIDKVEANITEEEVSKELSALQKRNSRMVIVDRPAKEGDTLLIDYAGFVGDNQFEDGTAERYPLMIGSDTFIPGFEEQLIGAASGEEKEVKVIFPSEYHSEELAGKEAIFKCKVHEIKEEELPELNDDFAKDVSEYDTLDELKNETRERLEISAKVYAENRMKNAVLEKVNDANDIDVPNVMIEDEIDSMVNEFDQQLKSQGLSIDQYFGYLKKDAVEFRAELKEEAKKKVKTRMILSKIADQESIVASDEEADKELETVAQQYKMELAQVKEMLSQDYIQFIKRDIVLKKAIELVYENAKII